MKLLQFLMQVKCLHGQRMAKQKIIKKIMSSSLKMKEFLDEYKLDDALSKTLFIHFFCVNKIKQRIVCMCIWVCMCSIQ